jgi:pimeloyl-ACP methyl ester carboxylesterase
MHLEENLQSAEVNGIRLVYDTFGNPGSPAVLLIMGLGAQMIDWREEFCNQLASHRYRVIRFDNRDIGKSEKLDHAGLPNLIEIASKVAMGEDVDVPYTLMDMAQDSIGLLDELEISKAHIVGLSMGGMIAQTMALHHPERFLTLTSIMSSTNEPGLPTPTAEAAALLTTAAPTTREDYIEYGLQNSKILGGSGYSHDETLYREHLGRRFDRGLHPPGFGRQLAAVLAAKGRKKALTNFNVPTLIIHGKDDPLVPVECGIDTAEAVPDSNLLLIDGWGHSLQPGVWPTIIEALVDHFSKVEDD